ncbi:MAG: tetratricopeptide repeat protein [Myxococcaceae bacterium]|nr:tetratricopeptide repeat protein [Myxococcaceae bacterium]
MNDTELDAALGLLRGTPPPLRETENAIWRRAQATAQGPSPVRQVAVFALATAAGIGAVLTVAPLVRAPAPARVVAAPVETRIEPGPGAEWSRDGRAITLARGRLRVTSPVKVTVTTPLATLEAKGARFTLDVAAQHVVISAEMGELLVRSQLTGERVVRAGERLVVEAQIDAAARVLPAALLRAPEPTGPRSACGAELDCLTRTAKGDTLAAQLALFDLGLAASLRGDREQATQLWRQYLTRFPDGALAPEVSGALIRALVVADPVEALAQAERYHARFGAEPSAGGVELLRAHLLRDVGGRPEDGCALFEALTAQRSIAVRGEALYQSAMCRQAQGDVAGSAARLDELRRVAPESERNAR